jgi:8-oxo-dGTP pyrophosphatase MutT (NUDIX family)
MLKKFKVLIVIASLAVTLSLMSNTYSRYIATSEGNLHIEFAKWQLLVNNTDITNESSSNVSFEPVIKQSVNVANNKVAPSSSGHFDIEIDPTNVDVSFKYAIELGFDNNLKDNEIHEWVKRAKVLVVNSQNEILIAHTNDSYYFLGGHVENDEADYECLVREIKEEAGIDYDPKINEPLVSIKYLLNDYPEKGMTKGYISNYYVIYDDLEPNPNNVNLTDGEKEGNLRMVYIHKDKILDEVIPYLEICKRRNVVRDTIDVLKEFLNK